MSPQSGLSGLSGPSSHPGIDLSIAVITRNEGKRLGACLDSVAFAGEIVVVDSGSTDDTVALAQQHGATVSQTSDWPGFGVQKNRAIDRTTKTWILSIDADERVTPELREQILAAITRADHDAYAIHRRSSYCGQYMLHSGWYPDPVVRLFKRGSARFSDDLVHESLQVKGSVGRLAGDMLHESFDDFEAVLEKTNRYSTAGAIALDRKGVKGSFGKAVGHGLWAFLRTYVFKRGFLDGKLGFALAISNAEGTYYRYLKLWLLQRR